MPLAAGDKLGPYEILSQLGAGGMGEVYRARDRRLSRDVALKILPKDVAGDPSRRARFDREARACAALNHPNIVAVYDTGQENDIAYIVSELIDGESLRAVVLRGPVAWKKLIAVGSQIARALAAAHGAGVTHRDLKPENIMLTRDARVKILDFGLAKLSLPVQQDSTMTQELLKTESGSVMGTVSYMSPEQVRGREVDPRSDIFSLGVVLYEMASGRRPFAGPSPADVVSSILTTEPLQLEGLPEGLARVIQRCLEKEAESRFQSAADLAFALESVGSGSSISAPAAVAGTAKLNRRTALWTGGVAAAAALGFAAGRFARSDPPRPLSFRAIPTAGERVGAAILNPDGKSLVYRAKVDGKDAVFHQSIAGGVPRLLALPEGSSIASISVRGELAFIRDRTLYRTPMDAIAPRAVLDNVIDANWSTDGESLQVHRRVGGKYRLEFPIGTILYEHTRTLLDPCLSHQTGRSAFALLSDGPRVLAVDRKGRVESLFEGPGAAIDNRGMFWALDDTEVWSVPIDGKDPGAVVAYSRGRQRHIARLPSEVTLCGITRESGALLHLGWSDQRVSAMTPGGSSEISIDLDAQPQGFSADGRRLVLVKLKAPRTESEVYLQDLDGSPAVLLGKGYVRGRLALPIAPDGQWVQVGRESGANWLIPTGAGQERRVEFQGLTSPIVIACIGEKWLIRAIPNGQGSGFHAFFQADPRTGQVERLKLDDKGDKTKVALSPDGTRVLFGDFQGKWEVAMLNGSGGPAPVPISGAQTIHGWTADSRGFYIGNPIGSELTIERYDLETGRRTPWKTFKSGRPDVTLDNFCLTPDGSAWAFARRRVMQRLVLADGGLTK